MMKIAIAVVAPLCLSLVACGGESSGTVPAPSSSATTAPTSSTAPDPTPAPSDSSSPTPAPTSTSTSTSTPDPQPPGEPGICAPNAACNGLTDCVDTCYGERCCSLQCDCNISTALLACTLVCH